MTRMRATRQREHVLERLGQAPTPLSAQELFVDLRAAGTPVALATVYRQLQGLAEEGVADRLVRDTGEVAFRLCASGHHHHLICDSCGRVEEVRDCRLDQWASHLASEHGFRDVAHAAEFHGTCRDCG